MAEPDLVVFDDVVARDWYPFSLTRPVGELLFGTLLLRERLERVSGARCTAYLAAAELAGFDEAGSPPVTSPPSAVADRPRLFISSRCILHWDITLDLASECTLRVADRTVGWLVPAGAEPPTEDDFLTPERTRGSTQVLGGAVLENVWDLVRYNPDHIASDILHLQPTSQPRPAHVHVTGKHPLVCAAGVSIEPGVVFDVAEGPVWLDERVKVRALSRIAGPFYAAPDTTLLGGSYAACSIGPHCKIHGEIEESVVLGYSNKAHDGFLGHAYVGKWVNLGAMTTNSDLKNNYSNVRVTTPAGEIDTGMMKLGSLIGDHVKTAIGTLLTTGTIVGPGANVLDVRPGKHVPPFSWGSERFDLDKFMVTAERAMQRRGVTLTEAQRTLLARAWQSGGSPA